MTPPPVAPWPSSYFPTLRWRYRDFRVTCPEAAYPQRLVYPLVRVWTDWKVGSGLVIERDEKAGDRFC